MELPFDALPDAVVSLVLEQLGLKHAAAARRVCRRFKQAVEATHWSHVDLITWSLERVDQLAAQLVFSLFQDVDRDAPAAARRWIRVQHRASLCVKIKGGRIMRGARAQGAGERDPWIDGALRLVLACTSASGGLGGIDVECPRSVQSCMEELLAAVEAAHAQNAPAARGSLRSLALRDSCEMCCRGLPPDLERRLRPFPALEELVLPVCVPASREQASTIARCLPRLKRLGINLETYRDADALAQLAALEFLDVCSDECAVGPLLEGLASGPAARSLREVECSGELSAAALRALPRLVALERLPGPFAVEEGAGRGDLAGLGACPALRSVGPLRVGGPSGSLAALLAGLADALGRSPRLRLSVQLADEVLLTEPARAALAGLALAGRGGRLDLQLPRSMVPPA